MVFRDYTNNVVVREHGVVESFRCKEAVKQGQLVELDTDDAGQTIEPSDADGGNAVGFAVDSGAIGVFVSVACVGNIVRATSGTGAVASGDLVASHGATGEEGEVASSASGDYVIGVALKDDVGTNDDVTVLVAGPSARRV